MNYKCIGKRVTPNPHNPIARFNISFILNGELVQSKVEPEDNCLIFDFTSNVEGEEDFSMQRNLLAGDWLTIAKEKYPEEFI